MNPDLLAQLSRERSREIRAEYARANHAGLRPLAARRLRPFAARLLRTAGDRLFRLGVALDDVRVSAASAGESSPS
jgi:hypothetical protein